MLNDELLTNLDEGNQIGVNTSIMDDEKEYLVKYGLQKHAGRYKVFVSKIEYLPDTYAWDEDHDYSVWDCLVFEDIEGALNFMTKYDFVDIGSIKAAEKNEQFFKISFFY